MGGFLVGLLTAIIVAAIALIAALAGALGVAAVGWVLHRLFDLSQWQGTVLAFGVAFSLGYIIYKALVPSPWGLPPLDLGLDDDEFDDEDEPLIVPWRRSRPSGSDRPPETKTRTTGRGKRRK